MKFGLGRLCALVAAGALAACGGGGDTQLPLRPPGEAPAPAPAPTPQMVSVGGTLTGLAGSITLREASGAEVTLNADGAFRVATVAAGTAYNVSVAVQPVGQTCTVANGIGTADADVTGIAVGCAATMYPAQVTVTGANAALTLTGAAAGDFAIGGSGTFTVTGAVAHGQAYDLGVRTAASQTCTLAGNTGTATGQPIIVQVTCAPVTWSLGGTVQGLTGTLGLRNSDGQTLSLAANGSFAFGVRLAHGAPYTVTVDAQPAGQTCLVAAGSGTANGDIASVAVTCADIVVVPPPPPAPDAATGLVATPGIKKHALQWNAITGANHYQVFEDPDAAGPQAAAQVGGDIAATTLTVEHGVLLHQRVNAQYAVRACNAGGCGPASAAVQPDMAAAVGYFKASNTGAGDNFGVSVALSGDGTTLAVGAFNEDSAAGAVYVFVRGAGGWTEEAFLKADNARGAAGFGRSLALSNDGATLAVGSPFESSNADGVGGDGADTSASNAGSAYVFTRSAGTWSQQAYVKATDSGAGHQFGSTLALSAAGDTLAVGAPGTFTGRVYVFSRVGATWSPESEVVPLVRGIRDAFGRSVALSADGNVLVAGATGEDSSTASPSDDGQDGAGAAYVFRRAGGFWREEAYLKASNIAASSGFGMSVAISQDATTIAVGAPFERSAATGIDGAQADGGLPSAGAVYVFARPGVAWTQQAYVKASNTEANDVFGDRVALSADGNVLAVSAPQERSNATGFNGDQANNARMAGAVYVFGRSGATWSQQAYVKATNTARGGNFGFGLALSADGRHMAVGDPLESSGATGVGGAQDDGSAGNSGAAYLY